MGYNYDYTGGLGSMNNAMANGAGIGIWSIIALVLALVGCFLVYFMFVRKSNDLKNPKLEWLRSFLKFDKMLIEPILKIAYIFAAIFLTLFSFSFFALGFPGFLAFLATITLGNIGLRVIYEAIMLQIMIWKNTSEIKNKLK